MHNRNYFTGLALKIAIIILFAVAAWRLAWTSCNIDLSKFEFSDLLALILALFAIAMSVAFYFKSTDSSNQFYDNIYNFTQKTSEILGRIEERFGERLKHLDEGYGLMQSRLDGISVTPDEIKKEVKKTEGKEEKEKQKLEETNKAMQEMMEKLANKAKLQQQEKEEFYSKLAKLAGEKDKAQERIREIEKERDRMQHQLNIMERDMMIGYQELRHPLIDEVLRHPEFRDLIRHGLPPEILKKRSRKIFAEMPQDLIERLRAEGIVNQFGELTAAGSIILRTMYRRHLR